MVKGYQWIPVKAPRKIAVFENIESNKSINSGQNEKVEIHREPDREDVG